jgi:hypothetical protein
MSEKLEDSADRVYALQRSAARAGADQAIKHAVCLYEDLNLERLLRLRVDSKWNKDAELISRRQAISYQIGNYANLTGFIANP